MGGGEGGPSSAAPYIHTCVYICIYIYIYTHKHISRVIKLTILAPEKPNAHHPGKPSKAAPRGSPSGFRVFVVYPVWGLGVWGFRVQGL